MVECTKEMIRSMEKEVAMGREEFEIGDYMAQLTADIISRTEFDSSYEKGKQIFHLLTVLQQLCAQASRHLCLPGSRYKSFFLKKNDATWFPMFLQTLRLSFFFFFVYI